VIKVTVKAY